VELPSFLRGRLVVRRAMLVLLAVAALIATASAAAADGTGLHFERRVYSPGERAVGHSRVHTCPYRGEPGEGPFRVYLVRGGQPLWYGHLPDNAVPVGLMKHGPNEGEGRDGVYDVTVPFRVPHIRDGRYQVWVCSRDCHQGFGDLVFGQIDVEAASTRVLPSDAPPVATAGASTTDTIILVAPVILIAIVAGIFLARHYRRRISTGWSPAVLPRLSQESAEESE